MMRLLLFAAVAATAAASFTPRPTSDLLAAFDADGFDVVANATYGGRYRGFTAASRNTTLLSTGQHKLVHYVEGDPMAVGYLMGYLMQPSAEDMVTTFIDHFIMSLISTPLDQKMSASPQWAGLYDDFTALLGQFLVSHANAAFAKDNATHTFPSYLLTEMHGVVAGARARNASTAVTLDRVITLNYGMDWLSVTLFSGALHNLLADYAQAAGASPALRAAVATLVPGDLHLPAFCDAFAVAGAGTASGTGSFFGRSFQLATALVFQDVQTVVVVHPDNTGNAPGEAARRPAALSVAPGMVGALTAMNADGVIMGVDTLRSAQGTPDAPGLNALMLVRSAVEASANTSDVVEFVANARRGCPFLYPVSDAAGSSAILEAAAYNASTTPPDPLLLVSDRKLKALLPTAAELAAASPEYRHGVYVRTKDYAPPASVLARNPALFALAGVPYNASSATNASGSIFPSWQAENAVWKALHSSYFSPSRLTGKAVVVSNLAVSPTLRVTEMNFWSDLFPADAAQWRADTLSDLVLKRYGGFTFDVAVDALTFLSPDRTKGYWHNYLDPNNPMSAQVEGVLVVADLVAKRIAVKGGYWADGFLSLHLPQYV